MKDNDYEKAKNLLRQISGISSQADLIKEQWSAVMNNDKCSAKLFIYDKGKSYETDLSPDTVCEVLIEILKKYRLRIKKAQDELNEIITRIMPVE